MSLLTEKSDNQEKSPYEEKFPYSDGVDWKDLIDKDLNDPFLQPINKSEELEPSVIGSKLKLRERWESKGFLLNEHWDNTFNIQSRILQIFKNEIICECLVDTENNIFENRGFERILFENINDLKIGKFIWLVIQTKKGSSRIDVFNGEGMVNKLKFNLIDKLKALEGLGLDNPIESYD